MTLFEGREVDGITVKLKSLEVATTDTFHHGAEVFVLCRAVIEDIQHPDKDGTLYRRQVAKPDDGWIVPQLTAARMIDAVEPPKLPGTERVRDVSKDATLDIEFGDDGSVTFIDTTTGEKHTAPPDDETAASIEERFTKAQEAVTEPAAAEVIEPERAVEDTIAAAVAGEPLDEPESKIDTAADKPASMIQRVALTKNILAFTEKLTEDFLAWQRKNGIPLNPEHMTFDQARRCLVFVGDIKNAEVDDG